MLHYMCHYMLHYMFHYMIHYILITYHYMGMSFPELMITCCLPSQSSSSVSFQSSTRAATPPLAIIDHSMTAVQVRLQRSSESFSMLGMELDTDCQHLLPISLGKFLLQHERKCQVMYVNQEVCTSIKDYVHQSSISRLIPCACRPWWRSKPDSARM